MKKILWQLLAIVVLVGVGYGLVRAYPSLLEKDADEAVVPVVDDTTSPTVEPGAYVLYQTSRIVDRGAMDWANDDVDQTDIYARKIGSTEARLLTSIKADESFGGSTWAEVVGQQVLVHRYTASGDAWVDLDGSVQTLENSDSARIASRNGRVWVDYSLAYANRTAAVSFNVQNGNQLDNNKNVVSFDLDPAELGIDMGYAEPFLVSDDGKTIYIRQICECDAIGLNGLWAFDVETQKLTKVSYVIENHIYEYQINTATNQLIGVSYIAPDNLGAEPTGPSAVHLVDMKTGQGRVIFTDGDFVFGHSFLSPDGSSYASDYRDNVVRVRKVDANKSNADTVVSGYVLDWVDDTLIVDRDGEIIFYDLLKDSVVSLAQTIGGSYADPDRVVVRYVGLIEIE